MLLSVCSHNGNTFPEAGIQDTNHPCNLYFYLKKKTTTKKKKRKDCHVVLFFKYEQIWNDAGDLELKR